ncbi:MAG: proteasome accessory factor PafA2 family protein [Planctomycetes bacterium]|nr:proteasome accessory factor PafA2 family protein [Planctomycetota bacterium]
MRIVGLETEYALGFAPAPGVLAPTQEALFRAVADALVARLPARPALYYKGGEFLADGSLLHFEVARLDAPHVGLLEWATPECLGPREAAEYSRAQEAALRDAVRVAQAALADRGAPGRLFLLKNNQDRRGNAYGCHESYDVRERPRRGVVGWLALALHPLVLVTAALIGVAGLLPALALLLVPALLGALAQGLAGLPLVGRAFAPLARGLDALVHWLAEPGRGPGSGALAHLTLLLLRVGGALFDLTGPRVVLTGHLPALLPFLATRPVIAGAGALTPDGRFELTARARVLRRDVGAFIQGPRRPLVDIKELFFRRPLAFLAARKRLHLLAGDASRAEPTELLKLETTALVLDAIEAGALDAVADSVELRDGAAGALRATASDPTLRRVVARDRRTHAPLTALAVQRRYLDAVTAWVAGGAPERAGAGLAAPTKGRPSDASVPPEAGERARRMHHTAGADGAALGRWRAALERLEADPRALDRELDWAIKLRLLSTALTQALPDRPVDRAWADLAAWGPVNALLEAHAPDAAIDPADPAGAVRSALGRWRGWRARRAVARAGLAWADLPRVRAAWLRLAALDLRYHELSVDGGPFDRLVADGRVEAALDPAAVARAREGPPARTRAAVRGRWVRDPAPSVRVGWDAVVVGDDAEARRLALPDPYRSDA